MLVSDWNIVSWCDQGNILHQGNSTKGTEVNIYCQTKISLFIHTCTCTCELTGFSFLSSTTDFFLQLFTEQ